MTTVAISESKIKLAWRETYLTTGENERTLALPRGVYRGYRLAPRSSADTWLRLLVDPAAAGAETDQFAIYAHRDDSTGTDGFCVSVREPTTVEFNCADMFPVVAATESWYVYLEATYATDATSTANYRVAKENPLLVASSNYNPDAVVFGVVPMTLGDTTIDFDEIADGTILPPTGIYAVRTMPIPAARATAAEVVAGDEMWGFFDAISRWNVGVGSTGRPWAEPTIVSVALAAATKFKLPGTYYVGRGAADTAGIFFRPLYLGYMSGSARYVDLKGSDGGIIAALPTLLRSDGVTVLTPSTDADAAGFYTDPYVQLDFTDTSATSVTLTIGVRAFQKKTLATLASAPASAFPDGVVHVDPHAARIMARTKAGSPTSLSLGTVQSQLWALLTAVNARIETIHHDSTPGDWTLLWRSHDATLDADVTKQTSSIYFGDLGWALLVGAYINSSGAVVAGTGTATYYVMGVILRTGTAVGAMSLVVKTNPAAASSWNLDSGWDTVMGWGSGGVTASEDTMVGLLGGLMMAPALAEESKVTIYADGLALLEETQEITSGVPQWRRYQSQYQSIWAFNCTYDATAATWTADVNTNPAFALRLGAVGMTFSRKNLGMTAAWADTTAGWSYLWNLGGEASAYNCLSVSGNTKETIRFGWSGVIGSDRTVCAMDVCNFRSRRGDLPVVGDITLNTAYLDESGSSTSGFVLTPLSAHIADIDEWGFRIFSIMAYAGVAGDLYRYDGSVTIFNS